MYVLAFDIGNTTISAALFAEQDLVARLQLSSVDPQDLKQLTPSLRQFLAQHLPSQGVLDGAVMTSVVPACIPLVQDAVRTLTECETLVLTAAIPCGIDLSHYDVAHLGTDRIVDMAAAASLYPGEPVAVWDLGTATTLSVIDANRVLIGGMISPGVKLGLHALHEHTAQLPDVTPEPVDTALGLDTASNMVAGSVAATGFMISAAADHIEQAYHLPGLHVVLTGGYAEYVLPWISRKDVTHIAGLQLHGMLAIWQLQQTDTKCV